ITEATRNARAAAERFASDAGSKVGSIRQAKQCVFSILPADQSSGTGEDSESNSNADSSLMKTVRVVTTVEYYLYN
ncbi:MAG: SIMPL domain-containing protein, partial [Acidobacteria bacterium]